jgi:hypothetical protein
MTDKQINEAIAEACGWKLEKNYWLTPEGCEAFSWDIPDYCSDLNAMHEAEKVLVGRDGEFCIYLTSFNLTLVGYEAAIHATARQRAEAFLRTLGKWEETK